VGHVNRVIVQPIGITSVDRVPLTEPEVVEHIHAFLKPRSVVGLYTDSADAGSIPELLKATARLKNVGLLV
jgi:hypothetical protein